MVLSTFKMNWSSLRRLFRFAAHRDSNGSSFRKRQEWTHPVACHGWRATSPICSKSELSTHTGGALRLGCPDFPGYCAKITGNPGRAHGILDLAKFGWTANRSSYCKQFHVSKWASSVRQFLPHNCTDQYGNGFASQKCGGAKVTIPPYSCAETETSTSTASGTGTGWPLRAARRR
jgi:hypothetical protein